MFMFKWLLTSPVKQQSQNKSTADKRSDRR